MTVPRYSHIVVVVEENKDYSEIIGNPQAPYINGLAAGGALLDNFEAITHPSYPNYLALYAGSTFGVTSDDTGAELDPTLATVLQGAGYTFTGYVEHPDSDPDHVPWEYFPEGTSVEQNFTSFPTSNFASLPTVSFVIPNDDDDMHSGTIAQGDSWLQTNLSAYAQWAVNNNSLLVVVWDEADTSPTNQIPAILYGADVVPGDYNTAYNDYNLLSTILGAYGLTAPNDAATAAPIAVFSTGTLGPTGPGPSDGGGGDGETLGYSVAGPVVINAGDSPLSLSAAAVVTAIGSGIDGVDSSLGSVTVNNDGTITSLDGFGIDLSGSGTINNGPRVGGSATVSGATAAINIIGGGGYIENWGSITGGDGIRLTNGGSVDNRPGGLIAGNDFGISASSGNSALIYNYGRISGATAAGVLLGRGGKIENESGGTISGGTNGVYVQYRASGMITNAGSIQGSGGAGVDLGDGGSVANSTGGTVAGSQFGVFVTGGPGTITNSGSISGAAYDGIVLGDGGSVTNAATATISGGSSGIYVRSGAAGNVTNAGTIIGTGSDAVFFGAGGSLGNAVSGAISSAADGVVITGGTGTVSNSGTISGSTTSGYGLILGAGGSVTNAGVISGRDGLGARLGGSILNNAGASIAGLGTAGVGMFLAGASGTVSNYGSITGKHLGMLVDAGGTITNAASASISGGVAGVFSNSVPVTVLNSGSVGAASGAALDLEGGGTVTNNSGGAISGSGWGMFVTGGTGSLVNSGNISGASGFGVLFEAGGGVTNNASASISGGSAGFFSNNVPTTLTNAGTITADAEAAADLEGGGSVTNSAGGVLSGAEYGVFVVGGTGTVANTGSITGTRYDGVVLSNGGSVTNSAAGSIIGGSTGIYVKSGAAGSVTNSGSILGQTSAGIDLASGGTVTNTNGASISGSVFGIFMHGGTVANAGTIRAGSYAITGVDRLIVNPGAVFVGDVAGDPNATIELTTGGALTTPLISHNPESPCEDR